MTKLIFKYENFFFVKETPVRGTKEYFVSIDISMFHYYYKNTKLVKAVL